jgi:asparagine synthase (glutamine-hydrolysing)
MLSSYLGGIWRRGSQGAGPARADGAAGWTADGPDATLTLHAHGGCARWFSWDDLALLVRGYARPAGSSGSLDLERLAEEIRCHYLEHGELAVDGLDGSFTLALLDAQAGRVLLYRNLIGTGFTYYLADGDRLLFGSNLAELVDSSGVQPRANRDVLPTFFAYRWVPGRETLFADFCRLMPGEEVCWDRRGLSRRQRHTFADLRETPRPAGEAVELLEATMTAVMADLARLWPAAANLLSGGIDSSYLQAVWGRVAAGADEWLPSFSVSVDHPRSWADTDYAVTASRALGSRHTLVPADGPYAGYLRDTLSATGEPPNHVQTAYFGSLAREMMARGVGAGLCGEGADSLFGLEVVRTVHNAELLLRLIPARLLRRLGAGVCTLLRRPLLGGTFRLANALYDLGDPEHPVNRAAVFTDPQALGACFGPSALASASAGRRALLDRYAVGDDPLECAHAAGFLAEAMDSAALWTTLFNHAGADLLCPFLDSRVLRLAFSLPRQERFPFRRPKEVLKRALARHAPEDLVRRGKLGFGQPIFEWLSPGGQLRPLVEDLGEHDFVDPPTLERLRDRPTWFLYSLICYDQWDRLFIRRCLPRPRRADAGVGSEPAPLGKP